MCARYVLYSVDGIAEMFGLKASPDLPARYNIAPSALLPCVVQAEGGKRDVRLFQWGLVPSYATDPNARKMINARAERVRRTLAGPMKYRRCLIPADGFYEWQGEPGKKQPYYITTNDAPFAFAGLYDVWETPDGYLETCTIITTEPNELVAPIHDRMPVIVPRVAYGIWLDTAEVRVDVAERLLMPYPAEEMSAVAIGKAVGNVRNDSPGLIEPIPTDEPLF